MIKIIDGELKTLMPLDLAEEGQKLWRYLFNIVRRNDLAQSSPKGGEAIAIYCASVLKEKNPEVFLS